MENTRNSVEVSTSSIVCILTAYDSAQHMVGAQAVYWTR